jgi:NAD+ diphosphatase
MATGLAIWHDTHRFCGRCGAETTVDWAGHRRLCPSCGREHFPRTDPAIIVAVTHDDRLLLARNPAWPPGFASVLAGFVEPGESLEDAVIREVKE